MKIEKVYRKDLKAHRWKIDITVDGQRIRRADFEKKQDAKEAIAALITQSRAKRYKMIAPKPKITLEELQKKAEQDRELKGRRGALRVFRQFVAVTGKDVELANLTKAHWKKYADSLSVRKLQAGTINRYFSFVSGVLSSASERFPDLDEWRPPKAPWLAEPPGRDRILSKEELAKLFAACLAVKQPHERPESMNNRREIYDLFRLMLLTGAREGEILNLRQSQVSWDWRTVRIESHKGRKGSVFVRVVPLSNLALEILEARKRHAPGFFKLGLKGLYRALRRIGELSGVAYGDKIDNGWVTYDLRHVAATVMESSGVPYSAVAAILGHKRTDQTATYAHAQLETLRRGVEVLENLCREIDGILYPERPKMPPIASERMQA